MKGKLDDKTKVILFDLDNTLIEVDLDKFIPQYLNLLSQSVAHIIPSKKFIAKILTASKAIEENDGSKSNEEVYAEKFFPLEGYDREEIKPFFDEFYEKDFLKLKKYTKKKPEAKAVVQKAFDEGYDVVIATTPMLPATAIEQRLEWAGVAEFPYLLITSIENCHATKSLTHLLYYDQILDKIGYPAKSCLMVGDDDKDLVAKRLGMLTYLIEQNGRVLSPEIPEPTFKGSLKDLLKLL